ncbi:MAG: response regulator transcription factor [Bryobacteraceae bacterium]|nr:response regulator transcription factor [Bryobacteraceae bacterium]
MKARKIRVLFVDDHPVLREGLAAIVNSQPDMTVVGEAGGGEEAVELFRTVRPDVTLMDLRLPDISGAEAIARIRRIDAEARVLVLSSYAGEEDIRRSLEAGAAAYLLKDTLRKELLEAIRTVHRGEKYVPATVAARLARSAEQQALTPRETEVLRLIVQGMSNKEIGAVLGATEGTVRIHVSNILAKLGLEDRTQAAVHAIQSGLVHL